MKSKLLTLFLMTGLLSMSFFVVSMELEYQDEENPELYPDLADLYEQYGEEEGMPEENMEMEEVMMPEEEEMQEEEMPVEYEDNFDEDIYE